MYALMYYSSVGFNKQPGKKVNIAAKGQLNPLSNERGDRIPGIQPNSKGQARQIEMKELNGTKYPGGESGRRDFV